jgi:hypothetical protein
MSRAPVRALFVEGLPGTGKTTAARWIHARLEGRGVAARWWREECADHPATPRTLRRTAATPGFAARCLAHWRRFASESRNAGALPILEGSAFQSTIRFMLEQEVPRDEILAYLRDFERMLAPLAPRLVYLAAPDPRAFLTDFVYPTRGPEWVAKVSAHLAATPCCRARGWSGPDGMLRFWLLYHDLCEAALAQLGFPLLRLATGPGHWARAEAELGRWVEGKIAARDPDGA